MKRKHSAGYHIAAVARMTGLSADTIRAWERRHGLVEPERDATGVRRYRNSEIVRLQRARKATENGHPIRTVAALSDRQLAALLDRLPDAAAAPEPGAAQTLVAAALAAVREYDAPRAKRIVRDASLLIEPRELILNVFVPLMYEVGRLWSAGDIAVWQEHLLSDIVGAAMGTFNRRIDAGRRDGFLFATPPGELHAFGIAFAATLAAAERFSVNNLGPGVPATEIAHAATHLRPAYVVVGAPRSAHCATTSVAFLAELERRLPPRVELWIGGPSDFAAVARTRARHVPTLADFARLLEAQR